MSHNFYIYRGIYTPIGLMVENQILVFSFFNHKILSFKFKVKKIKEFYLLNKGGGIQLKNLIEFEKN